MNRPRSSFSALRPIGLAVFALAQLIEVPAAAAQLSPFMARLSTVPLDASMRTRVTGSGQASASLNENVLTISGTFAGLQRPATFARLHMGQMMGLRGNVIYDLSVTKATSGSLEGTLDLSSEQVEALRAGRLYIQIYSESAPEGNLWGWLLE